MALKQNICPGSMIHLIMSPVKGNIRPIQWFVVIVSLFITTPLAAQYIFFPSNLGFERGLEGWAHDPGVQLYGPPDSSAVGTEGTHAVALGVSGVPGSYVTTALSLKPGAAYELRFDLAAIPQGSGQKTASVEATLAGVGWNVLKSEVLSCAVPEGFSPNGSSGFLTRSVFFQTPESVYATYSAYVYFKDVSENGGQGVDPLIDNILLIAIDSPATNTPPSIFLAPDVGDQVTQEDRQAGPVSLKISDRESSPSLLSLSGLSSNPSLVRDYDMYFGGSGADRTVAVYPRPGLSGTTRITVIVTDPGGLTGQVAFNVIVENVDDLPEFGPVGDFSGARGTPLVSLGLWISDPDTPAGKLTLSATSSNPNLVANANISVVAAPPDNPDRPGKRDFRVEIIPHAGQIGIAAITLSASDGKSTVTKTINFILTENSRPRISTVPDQSVPQGATLGPLAFTVDDDETPDTLTVSATTSNNQLLPPGNIQLQGTGVNRSLTLTPVAGKDGSVVIILTVSDGEYANVSSFKVTVAKTPSTPVISVVNNQIVTAGSTLAPVEFTLRDDDTSAGQLTVQISSSDPGVAPLEKLVVSGGGTIRALTIGSVAGHPGTSTIRLTVSDGLNTSFQEFKLTVLSGEYREMRLATVTGERDSSIRVPLQLTAKGGENLIKFSIRFDPGALIFGGISNPSGAELTHDTSRLASGWLGVTLTMPPGRSFATATGELVTLVFGVLIASPSAQLLAFADEPTPRAIVSTGGAPLPVFYFPEGVTSVEPPAHEGDLSPRATGNGSLTVADWVQAGRFAAGLDTPANASEFQRADCAPRVQNGLMVLGDGKITVADWVQAGRYAAALDGMTPVGGPDAPLTAAGWLAPRGGRAKASEPAGRIGFVPVESGEVVVELHGPGIATGVGFSVNFDSATIHFLGAELAPGMSGASLQVNESSAASGQIGIVAANGAGGPFPAGTTRLVHLRFMVLSHKPAPLTFGDTPVQREVADAFADALPVTFVDGVLPINTASPTRLNIWRESGGLVVSWPGAGGVLEETSDLAAGTWLPVAGVTGATSGYGRLNLSVGATPRFFRVRFP